MSGPRSLAAALALAAAAAALPASARAIELGAGADWIPDRRLGVYELTLGTNAPIVPALLDIGGRTGVLWLGPTDRVGVPLDARLRLSLGLVYVEGLVGPWFLPSDPSPILLHTAVGAGMLAGLASFGVEAGTLGRNAVVGLRLSIWL